MKTPNLYNAFAVILPVSLGLGLVYLSIVGRIDAGAAVFWTVGLAVFLGALVFLRDVARDPEMEARRRR